LSEEKNIFSLRGILDAAEKIVEFSRSFSNADDFFSDQKSFDAACMNFIVIGEMVDRISDDFKLKYSEIDWKSIKGLRNIMQMITSALMRRKSEALVNCIFQC
jgi:uncharacterized protein with HEPN domain